MEHKAPNNKNEKKQSTFPKPQQNQAFISSPQFDPNMLKDPYMFQAFAAQFQQYPNTMFQNPNTMNIQGQNYVYPYYHQQNPFPYSQQNPNTRVPPHQNHVTQHIKPRAVILEDNLSRNVTPNKKDMKKDNVEQEESSDELEHETEESSDEDEDDQLAVQSKVTLGEGTKNATEGQLKRLSGKITISPSNGVNKVKKKTSALTKLNSLLKEWSKERALLKETIENWITFQKEREERKIKLNFMIQLMSQSNLKPVDAEYLKKLKLELLGDLVSK